MTDLLASKNESTYQTILQAAYELFIHQGYHGTSMRQIADNAHIALGGIYNHFASKQDIFREVFFAYHPYHDVLPALEADADSPIEAFVRNGVTRATQALDQRPGFLNLMFIEMVEFNGDHVRELFQTLMPRALVIAEGMTASNKAQLKPIPPLILIRAIIALLFGFYLTSAILEPISPFFDRRTSLDQFLEIFLHGVLVSDHQQKTQEKARNE